MNKKYLIHYIVALQLILLLFVPRFGWSIHHPNATVLRYTSTYRENGYVHATYRANGSNVDIVYKNRFSREFYISIDGDEMQHMRVFLDGRSEGTSGDLFTSSDIVWRDSSGTFYRIYAFSLALTIMFIVIHRYANKKLKRQRKIFQIIALTSLGLSLLISLRIIM
jgi:hypothetical protein